MLPFMRTHIAITLLASLALLGAQLAYAVTPEQVSALAFGESDQKLAVINALTAAGDDSALPLLQSLAAGQMQTVDGKQVLIVKDGGALDAVTGKPVSPVPENAEDVIVNNRMRGELAAAIGALRLTSKDQATRLQAAEELARSADESLLPLVSRALAKETDTNLKNRLKLVEATLQLKSKDAAVRLAAVTTLAESDNPNTQTLLAGLLEKHADAYVESDAAIRTAAQHSLNAVQARLAWGERLGQLFTGVSLGSILLLAALGLAITYGLMGVINMAHGELIMVGAYATYVVQNLFRSYAPGAFDWYLPVAVPAAFLSAGLVGALLERCVIRFLYGRPLETLLATWGISLILIQTVRMVFGAQNVQVENPVWMSGGVQFLSNVVLPYSRIVIIGFAAFVVLAVWLMLTRTRLGLFVRSVTQNRAMASCVGVPTARVDTLAFALGSGIAGLAGCALSQIGNVGPDLGQSYIVDSFMVVVLGGVGQLAGTVYAGLGLGIANKFLEGWSGAVLAKIIVLAFIIIFIQKRPQGLFALKGRTVES
jgi:urea transport system permease protein